MGAQPHSGNAPDDFLTRCDQHGSDTLSINPHTSIVQFSIFFSHADALKRPRYAGCFAQLKAILVETMGRL